MLDSIEAIHIALNDIPMEDRFRSFRNKVQNHLIDLTHELDNVKNK